MQYNAIALLIGYAASFASTLGCLGRKADMTATFSQPKTLNGRDG
jgi:hypothetical protein